MHPETRPPRNPLAAGCTGSFSAPRPGLRPRAQPGQTRLPALEAKENRRASPRRTHPWRPSQAGKEGQWDALPSTRFHARVPGRHHTDALAGKCSAGSPLLGAGGGGRGAAPAQPRPGPPPSDVLRQRARLPAQISAPPPPGQEGTPIGEGRPRGRAGPSCGSDWSGRPPTNQRRSPLPQATPSPQARARGRCILTVRALGSPPPPRAQFPAAAAACNLRRQDVAGG